MARSHVLGPEGLVNRSWDIAQAVHEGQKYGEEPYFYHVFEVANLSRFMGYGNAVVAACFLHDSVEDTSATLEQLRLHGFPESVVAGVEAVTFNDKVDNPEGLTGRARKELKLGKAMRTPLGHVVKFCDSSRNFAHTVSYPRTLAGDNIAEYAADYAENIAILGESLPSPQAVREYVLGVDGEPKVDNKRDVERSWQIDRWTQMEKDIQATRMRIAKNNHKLTLNRILSKVNW